METHYKSKTVEKTYHTASGISKTKEEVELNTMISEFSESKEICMNFNICKCNLGPHCVMIGRRNIHGIWMIINFKQHTITWDGTEVAKKGSNE